MTAWTARSTCHNAVQVNEPQNLIWTRVVVVTLPKAISFDQAETLVKPPTARASKDEMKVCWHYTIDANARMIFESGVIKPATLYLTEGERPITWFSVNPVWENTVQKALLGTLLDRHGLLEHGIGLVRIGVALETAPLRWQELRELSGMPSKVASGLLNCAHKWYAAPAEWRGTFEPVPRDKWLSIETYDKATRTWVPMSDEFTDELEEVQAEFKRLFDELPANCDDDFLHGTSSLSLASSFASPSYTRKSSP
jgi:hypothetical protein